MTQATLQRQATAHTPLRRASTTRSAHSRRERTLTPVEQRPPFAPPQPEDLAREAVERERQRLARELHDTVSQQLFSASLLGEALLKVWATDPARGAQYLHDLRLVTQGALAEMRALLVELRPAALVTTPLPELLRQLADAMSGRLCVPVTLTTAGCTQLPGEVQVALYRVAQEALNNIARHADASRVSLSLQLAPDAVELVVEDDGRGFDPTSVPANHFGLAIMHERIGEVGGTLEVTSRPGAGTRLRARWSSRGA